MAFVISNRIEHASVAEIRAYSLKERIDFARRGWRLEVFLTDPSPFVRDEVARKGFGVEILSHDPDFGVCMTLIQSGYMFDHFLTHENWEVRREAVKYGHGLKELANDPVERVRNAVKRKLEEINKVQERN